MKRVLFLFDIDGTLTSSRKVITDTMKLKIQEIASGNYKNFILHMGIVGGSDLPKQQEQLGECWNIFDYQFAENGLVFYKGGEFVKSTSFVNHIGQEKMNDLLNIFLNILSKTECPEKTGTFIEHRTGLINVCPVGRSCTLEQREKFFEYDKVYKVRENIKSELERTFTNQNNIKVSIGGQISLDVFPVGWDKTYCLKYVEKDYDDIHFFGDKTDLGGNDYEIYHDNRTVGHAVSNPNDTITLIEEIIEKYINDYDN